MKEKLKKHFRANWQEYASVILMLFIIMLGLCYNFNLKSFDIRYPIAYVGGDDFGMLVDAKMLSEQGWVLESDRLGAPYSQENYDFSSNLLHNAGLLLMKFFVLVSGNYIVGLNLTYFFVFILAGIIAYIVMRQIGVSCWISSVMSAVYGLSPYMISRGIGHMVLAEAYFVPLSFLLCFWIMERDDVFRLEKNFFKKPANYAVIIMALLIANNGIAYYPYFTCFILLVTGVSKWLKTKKPAGFLKSLSMVGLICVFLVLALLPAKIYTMINGGNSAAVNRFGFVETEMYGLKLIMLFMPRNSHGIDLFQRAITEYDTCTTFLNENITEYLGVVAIIGFFVLMFSLFMNRESAITKRLAMLSEINIMLIILGTTSGLGTIIAFLITDKIRGYNRISIFIECGCILGMALLCDYWVKKKKSDNKRLAAVAIAVVTGIVCVFSVWEGCMRVSAETYSAYQAEFDSDENFVSRIEDSVEEGAMIYQLPYHQYPEGGAENNMWDYHLYIGFLHSDNLKWSYGSIKGREGDAWNEAVSEMDNASMVKYLKAQGFAGIYIDRRAYTSDEISVLEGELKEITGYAPIVSENGNLSFFKF